MEKAHLKLGASDVVGIFLGLLSWLFPGIPEWIKIGVTLIVMAVTIFLALSKSQRASVGAAAEKTIVNYIIPFIGGAFKGIFVTTVLIALVDVIFNIHLVVNSSELFSPSHRGTISFFFYVLGNLTKMGNIVLVLGAIIGGVTSVENANKKVIKK